MCLNYSAMMKVRCFHVAQCFLQKQPFCLFQLNDEVKHEDL